MRRAKYRHWRPACSRLCGSGMPTSSSVVTLAHALLLLRPRDLNMPRLVYFFNNAALDRRRCTTFRCSHGGQSAAIACSKPNPVTSDTDLGLN